MNTEERVAGVIEALKLAYPDPMCALHYKKDYELMIAVRLSAQCTDERVNMVTPALFARYPTLDAFADADIAEVETYVHSCGFYKHKARDIVLACQMLREEYGRTVPDNMDALLRLPGVGRKTANIVLNNAFGIVEGIAVDTHVFRIATRLGFTSATSPLDAEKDLLKLIPHEWWGPVNHQWVLYGRQVCDAKKPACVAELEIGGIDGPSATKSLAKTKAYLDAIGTYPDASGREAWSDVGIGLPCPLADLCPSRGTCLRASAKGGSSSSRSSR